MFINNSMTKKVITVSPEESVSQGREKLLNHNIRHLPVVDEKGKLIGITTDRDFRSAISREEKEGPLKIKDVMTKDVITMSYLDTIQDALMMIQKKKVGAVPIIDENGILKGILSVRDLLRAFINVLGIGEPGTLFGIVVEQKIGQMKRIVDAITEENISVGSILVARYWDKDKRAVFPYLLTNNVTRIKKKLTSLGFTLIDPMKWYLDQLPKTEK